MQLRSVSLVPLSFIDGRRQHGNTNKAGLSLGPSRPGDNFFFAIKWDNPTVLVQPLEDLQLDAQNVQFYVSLVAYTF